MFLTGLHPPTKHDLYYDASCFTSSLEGPPLISSIPLAEALGQGLEQDAGWVQRVFGSEYRKRGWLC